MFVIRLQSVHTSTLGRICLRTRNTQNTLMRTTLPATVNSTCEGHPSRQVRTCVQGCYKTNISFVWIIFNRCVFHSRRKCLNHALLAFLTVKQARSCLNVAFQFRVIEFELVENSQNSQWNSLVVTQTSSINMAYTSINWKLQSPSAPPTPPPGLAQAFDYVPVLGEWRIILFWSCPRRGGKFGPDLCCFLADYAWVFSCFVRIEEFLKDRISPFWANCSDERGFQRRCR